MKVSTTFLALSASLLACAKPMEHEHLHKRHGITKTVWEVVTVTVDVTVTLDGPGPAKVGQINLAPKPNDNHNAKPTPKHHKAEAKVQAPGPAPKAPAQPNPGYQPPVQKQQQPPAQHHAQAPAQHAANPPPNPPPKHEAPPPQQPQAPKQPAPKSKPKPEGGSTQPSGGSCGQVGGKCMASDVTIYNDQGTGACGWQNDTNSEDFFALAANTFGAYTNDAPGPHKNAFCGRMAMISVGGKTVPGMLTDKCPGCNGWSIDLSQSLWNKVFDGEANTRKNQIAWWFTGPEIFSGPG